MPVKDDVPLALPLAKLKLPEVDAGQDDAHTCMATVPEAILLTVMECWPVHAAVKLYHTSFPEVNGKVKSAPDNVPDVAAAPTVRDMADGQRLLSGAIVCVLPEAVPLTESVEVIFDEDETLPVNVLP